MEFLVKVFVSILGFIGGNYINIGGIDISLVSRENGLYENDNGVYVFRGLSPNNYISFNNELWRIMSIDADFIKIVKNDSIGNMAFDDNNSNEWEESSLNKYLKGYYDSFSFRDKEISNGKIEIISMEDYLEANSNLELCSSLDSYFANDERCFKTNYINALNSKNGVMWTLTKDEDTVFYVGNTYFNDIRPSDSGLGVLPVLYLDKNIELYGNGTLHNPYKILF